MRMWRDGNGSRHEQEDLSLWPDLPIIICTGFNELLTEEKAKAIGKLKFVMKPLNLKHIATLIRKAVEE